MNAPRLPGTPSLLRVINDRAALDLLLARGPLTRAQIGKFTGLSKVTASQLVERLEQRGLVTPAGAVAGGRGPNARLYSVVPDCAYVIGVDVGPKQVVAASADITGRIIARIAISTRDTDGPVGRVHAAVMDAARQAGAPWERVRRVILGTPGVVDPATGDLTFAFDLPRWQRGLRAALAADLDRPVALENDVNLAAVAEGRLGAARGVDDFALVWVGRGVGLATVLGGQLHRGAAGAAGEIGYLYTPGTSVPDSDRTGNAWSLLRGFGRGVSEQAVRELGRRHGFRGVTAAQALAQAAAAVAGGGPAEAAGAAMLDGFARALAVGVANVCLVLDPPLVVIAGGIGAAGGPRLAAGVQEQVARLTPVCPRVRVTEVPDDPVLEGAIATALDQTRDELFSNTAPA